MARREKFALMVMEIDLDGFDYFSTEVSAFTIWLHVVLYLNALVRQWNAS